MKKSSLVLFVLILISLLLYAAYKPHVDKDQIKERKDQISRLYEQISQLEEERKNIKEKLESCQEELARSLERINAFYYPDLNETMAPQAAIMYESLSDKKEKAYANYRSKKGIKTTLRNLFVNPEKFNGERVIVIGYFKSGYWLCPDEKSVLRSEGCVSTKFEKYFDEQLLYGGPAITVKGIFEGPPFAKIIVEEVIDGL